MALFTDTSDSEEFPPAAIAIVFILYIYVRSNLIILVKSALICEISGRLDLFPADHADFRRAYITFA